MLKPKMAFPLALVMGALSALAFAPLNIWLFAFLSPISLLWLWQKANSPKQVFYLGLVYGLGLFGIGISWVFISIHRFGNTDIPLAVFIMSLLILLYGFLFGMQGYLLKRFFKGSPSAFCLLGFPSSWVLFEWFRSVLFTGFPWLFIGYTELNTPLSGYAKIGSVYAVSFIVTLISGMTVVFFSSTRQKKIVLLSSACLIIVGGFFLQITPFTKTIGKEKSIVLVQGNITPLDKFSQENPIQATEEIYGRLTQKYWGVDFILWPESAVPLPLPYSKEYTAKLDAMAKKHRTTFITGIQSVNDKNDYFNSLIVLGTGKGLYHKHHLLPYGDYLPFEKHLRGLINFFNLPMSSFTPGGENQELITAQDLTFDPLICYEIAFPELVRTTLRNANAIITLSEDGWFGDSWGPHQHLEIARMRALETGRWVLRATTSGITALIDENGKIQAQIPRFQATILQGTFQPMTGNTPWVTIGLWPLLILLLLGFVVPGRRWGHSP